MQTALTPVVTPALVPPVDSPLPVFSGEQMGKALAAYRDLQRALDREMPDQIMQLDGRPFRKKGYWRAIATAFNLKLEPIEERREVSGQFEDGRENFGYVVTYRAIASNGRSATGDGACFAVEKARRFRCPHPHSKWPGKTLHFPQTTCPDFDPHFQWRALPEQATEHNVRSHATTRATNRAISNLVAFGEVSAEEVERDREPDGENVPAPRQVPAPKPKPALKPQPPGPQTIVAKVLGVLKRPMKAGGERYVLSTDPIGTYITDRLEDATTAKAAQEAGLPIEITYTATPDGRLISALRELDLEEPPV